LPIRRTRSASGVRRVRPTSACASALGPATALSGTTGRTRHRRSDRVHGLRVSTPQPALLHEQAMIDRTPLLRFLSPSALACHATLPGAATRTGDPASTVDRLSHATSFTLDASWHRVAPTHGGVRSVLAVFRAGGVGPIDSARIDAARFDRDAPSLLRATRVAASNRASRPPRVMRRRLSAAGVPLPARAVFTWPGRAPLSVAKLLVFRPVNVAGGEAGRLSRV
jgi:hypothetical protein